MNAIVKSALGKVPEVTGKRFLAASAPAIASTGTITPNRPSQMAIPNKVL